MELSERAVISAPPDRVWSVIMDVPTLASCIPGAEASAAGEQQSYQGTIRMRLGPVTVEMDGTVVIKEADAEQRRAVMEVEGIVRRAGGSVRGTMTFELSELSPGETELRSAADLQLMKTLAMLDNALVQRKASSMFQEFAGKLAALAMANPS